MTREEELINHIKEYLDSGMWKYEACYLGKEDLEIIIKALEQEPCGDYVSREVIDEVKELMTDINGHTVYAVKMSDIRQLPPVNPQEPKTEWIPVSERLPEDDDLYFVTFDNGETDLVAFDRGAFSYSGVIAWMPLPEPYKAESEG